MVGDGLPVPQPHQEVAAPGQKNGYFEGKAREDRSLTFREGMDIYG